MKKTLLSTIMMCCCMIAMAQPQGFGFGGFGRPQANPDFKDINYAGDDRKPTAWTSTCPRRMPSPTKSSLPSMAAPGSPTT